MEQQTPVAQPHKMTGRTKAALWLLIGPTALWVVLIVVYALVNWVFAAVPDTSMSDVCSRAMTPSIQDGSNAALNPDCSDELFGSADSSIVRTIANIFLFMGGVVAFLSWLPGLIIGIVLLATKAKTSPTA